MVYVPIQQPIDLLTGVTLAVRDGGDAPGVLAVIRQRTQAIIPGGFITNIVTVRQLVNESLLEERLMSILASLFGGLALLLAAIGLYGIMSFSVIRRTREIGIRIAVGAQRSMVLRMVLRQVSTLIGAGLLLAVPLVYLTRHYIESELFGIEALDPLALSSAAVLLFGVAVAAGAVPAWRVARVDPLISLRHE
jgi:ABC-type antimicrobial peptide transport system permease subunit